MSDWTEERKQKAIELYQAGNPTPENTMELVEEVADELEVSKNAVRMILTKAEVYVAKGKAASTNGTAAGDKPKRKTKQESLDELAALIEEHGGEVDDTIVSKMTGKAAEYFITIIKHVIEN